MKVFKVWVDKCDYETYDAFVCVANSEDEIRKCISIDKYNRRVIAMKDDDEYEESINFEDFQGEIHIDEVHLDVAKPHIVLASYNAG